MPNPQGSAVTTTALTVTEDAAPTTIPAAAAETVAAATPAATRGRTADGDCGHVDSACDFAAIADAFARAAATFDGNLVVHHVAFRGHYGDRHPL